MTINRLAACAVLVLCAATRNLPAQVPLAPIPTTLATFPEDSEGLAVDPNTETLYVAGSPDALGQCAVRSISMAGVVSFIGYVPRPTGAVCAPKGLEFRSGRIYISDQGVGTEGWVFEMDPATGQSSIFAAGVAGANGIVFDSHQNLWITDGLRGLGRVYRRDASGAVWEMFRVPPVANGTSYGGRLTGPTASGIGRQISNVPGTLAEVKAVANGIAVVEDEQDHEHDERGHHDRSDTLYVADTARGAIWTVRLDKQGDLVPGQTGCDLTLQSDTLCDAAVFVSHPRLEGADGISADRRGALWIAANSRQAIVRVDRQRRVTEIFRNPVNSQMLRSSGDTTEDNAHILEYPSSPVIVPGGRGNATKLCVASNDRPARDNWPGTTGEIGGPGQSKGKVSCF